MRYLLLFMSCTILAGLVPLVQQTAEVSIQKTAFPGWPTTFRGKKLVELELSDKEKAFTRDFPGVLGRFTDGDHEILIRWIQRESRKLHPASDCLKGSGYAVSPKPIEKDSRGNQWGCFQANNGEQNLHVCERIFDDEGNSWSDVSSWFWSALVGQSKGPWWAMTIASTDQR